MYSSRRCTYGVSSYKKEAFFRAFLWDGIEDEDDVDANFGFFIGRGGGFFSFNS